MTRQAILATALGSAVFIWSAYAFAEDEFRIGVISPQTGACAQWGIPTSQTAEFWADELNAKGGIMTSDGKRHLVAVSIYDNDCYSAGGELKAARRAILDDDVHYILQTYTPASRQAIGPLTNEHQVLAISYGAGFVSAKFPFLVGAVTGSPMNFSIGVGYLLETHPEINSIAFITANTSYGLAAKAYLEAGLEPYKDRVKLVYNQSYDAGADNDMLGLLTPVIQSKPDLIFESGFTPSGKAVYIATALQLGYKGLFASDNYDPLLLQEQGVMADAAGRVFAIAGADGSEPTFSPVEYEFYQRYTSKNGKSAWTAGHSVFHAALMTLEKAVNSSPSINSKDVLDVLYSTKDFEHPVYGMSHWSGQEIFGANHHLLTPMPIYGFNPSGQTTLVGKVDVSEWWEKHKEAVLPALSAAGQTFVK